MVLSSHFAAAYTQVGNWIQNGGNVNGGASAATPYLFCYHNWLQKYKMTDSALDDAGEEFPNVFTGVPMLINEVPEYVTRQQEETNAIGSSAVPVCYAITLFPSSNSPAIHCHSARS